MARLYRSYILTSDRRTRAAQLTAGLVIGLNEAALVDVSLVEPFNIGLLESVTLTHNTLSLVAAESIGLLESVTVTHDHLSLVVPITIGLVSNFEIGAGSFGGIMMDGTVQVRESMAMGGGLYHTVALGGAVRQMGQHQIFSLTGHQSIGVTLAATVAHNRISLSANCNIGLAETATLIAVAITINATMDGTSGGSHATALGSGEVNVDAPHL